MLLLVMGGSCDGDEKEDDSAHGHDANDNIGLCLCSISNRSVVCMHGPGPLPQKAQQRRQKPQHDL